MNFTPAITHAPIQRPNTHLLLRMFYSRPLQAVEEIQRVVADAFGVPLWTMVAKDRPEYIAKPRMVAMSLARELTGLSFNTIGQAFGGRDHGTVIHACRTVKDWASIEPALAELIEQLKQRCKHGTKERYE